MKPFLQVKNIAKEFPGVKALEDISIDFYPGECHALVGENGAGKSTLIKIIASIYKPTRGEVLLDGKVCNFKSPKDALDEGIAVIAQETAIAPHLTVAENMYLGCEPKKANGLLDRKKMGSDAQDVLLEMGLEIDPHILCATLTAAQLQMVEIAKVISKRAKVVVLDEPTSSLSEKEIESLFEQIRKMKAADTTMIYVTHRMAELPVICERCSIFRDGLKVAEYKVDEVSEQTIVNSMVGRELGAYVKPEHTAKEEVLRVEDLCREGVFKNIHFHANAGEIVAFSGLVGAGGQKLWRQSLAQQKLHPVKYFYMVKKYILRTQKTLSAEKSDSLQKTAAVPDYFSRRVSRKILLFQIFRSMQRRGL